MTLKDRIALFAVRDLLGKMIADATKDDRSDLAATMLAEGGQTMRALLPDGSVLGTLSYRKGSASVRPTGPRFEAYIREHYPHAVIPEATQVVPEHIDPAFVAAFVKRLKESDGDLYDPDNGEAVPDVETSLGKPSVAFKAEADARSTLVAAIASGSLDPMRALEA